MKPSEEYEVGPENIIIQLGMLILKGRIPQDVQSNENRSIRGDISVHYDKGDFLMLWKSCEVMYIEVWLHRDEQFHEEDAMDGHNGYLLIEQWHIEIKQSSSSETGFHCTEKMLIQAIKSKLYFSQLSAWLNLTKAEFPKHIYFRLCRCQSKAPLHRYCRPPEFHQFPRVKITSFQELFISLHSLPRSDISKDLPTYAWVLADPRTGTPKRTSKNNEVSSGKKLAYPTPSKACFEREIGRDSVGTNAVRKLKFPEPSYCKKAGLRSSVASTRTDQAKLNPISKPGLGTTSSLTTAQPTSVVSLDCLEGDGNKNYGSLLPRQDVEFSEHDNGESFGEMLATAVVGCAALDETVKNGNSRSCRPLSTRKSVDFNKGEVDVGLSQSDTRTDNSRSNEKCYNEAHNTSISASDDIECGKNERVSKPLTSRTTKKLILSSDRCKHNDRANFRTFSAQKVTGSVCYKCESQLGLSNSNTTENNFHGNSMSFIDNNCASYGIFSQTQSNNLSNLPHGLKEYSKLRPDRSSLEQNEFCLLDERRTSKLAGSRADELQGNLSEDWPVTKKDPVLPGVRKGIEEVLPGMRHVIEKEYKRKINEKLWNCLSPESPYSGGDQRTTSEFTETKERVRTKKDDVFTDKKTTISYPTPLATRHHFRHASTGTLPVFHPNTRLPMSSSPAPFRKTRGVSTMDDIQSPPCNVFDLHSLSNVLSKSAPALTTQSLLGNFEESVLNDRLLPDGVVEGFTAELGASSSKKCLAHVTLPVQAYFFKLSDDNAPSPYMGYISLDIPELSRKGYHVPKKGTIQLTLFNPNQTVVKVFVVLYDFSDMQPNFQTFLRQKTTSFVESDSLVDRSHNNLHYLIHLRFASSKSGRIYLHTDIRLIFARHPPDQLYLRTTTSGPTNPKYVPRQHTK